MFTYPQTSYRRNPLVPNDFHFGPRPALESECLVGRVEFRELYLCRHRSPRGRIPQKIIPERRASMKSSNLTEHLLQDCYGDFVLTDAVRPSLDRQVVPRQGYRIETYRDAKAGFQVPVLAAAVSREQLFDVFLDLLDPL